jgi:6-phosphogluconolactonase
MLPFSVTRGSIIYPDAERLAIAAASIVADAVRPARPLRLVLAGGTTPLRAYALLAGMQLPWGHVTVLFGDERCLPADHPETNFNLADGSLLRVARAANVHRIAGELGPDEAAAAYEPIVSAAPLDLVLLGIGTDGHTASLFPDNDALRATGWAVGVRNATKPPPERVSLTLRALRGAKRVVILASGGDKKDAVRTALTGKLPAGMIEQAEFLITADAAP